MTTKNKSYWKLFIPNLISDFKERPVITTIALTIMGIAFPFVAIAWAYYKIKGLIYR